MFELENEVRRWRDSVEREFSLSPRELDELEDHLRARVELEMELDAALAPTRALAIAQEELGQASALSQEFARAGKPRWRRWLVAGWAMFGVSFLLPTVRWNLFLGIDLAWDYGYELFWRVFTDGAVPLLLPSLAMILSIRALLSPSAGKGRWLGRILGAAGGICVAFGIVELCGVALSEGRNLVMGPGYWMWSLSLVCVAIALQIRDRDWASTLPRPATS